MSENIYPVEIVHLAQLYIPYRNAFFVNIIFEMTPVVAPLLILLTYYDLFQLFSHRFLCKNIGVSWEKLKHQGKV